jgi:hypothetical protein
VVSLQTREPAADLGQHEMAADESHLSVAGVDLLLAGVAVLRATLTDGMVSLAVS